MLIEMPAAVYHARPEANKSLLDRVEEAPAKAEAYLKGPRPEPTPAMRFGTAVHAAVLEPETLVQAPKFNRRTLDGQAEERTFNRENAGKVIVDPETYTQVQGAREGVMRHPVARRIFEDGLPERSVFSELYGVPVKCRPDWYRGGNADLLADLKTTTDASPEGFAKSVANFRYHVQASFYADVCRSAGVPVRSFVFVAVESKPPFLCAVYVLDEGSVAIGRESYIKNLDTLKRCRETGIWPGFSESIEVISLPRWATKSTTQESY